MCPYPKWTDATIWSTLSPSHSGSGLRPCPWLLDLVGLGLSSPEAGFGARLLSFQHCSFSLLCPTNSSGAAWASSEVAHSWGETTGEGGERAEWAHLDLTLVKKVDLLSEAPAWTTAGSGQAVEHVQSHLPKAKATRW